MRKLLVLLSFAALTLQAQETTKKSDAEAAMEFYREQAKPVAEHARLTELVGPWKVSTKLWFGPNTEPLTTTGTATGKMILGGRFLQLDSTLKGAFAEETLSILGFDRRTNDYTLTGYDTMGTYSVTAAGKYDAAQKAVVLRGSYKQPPANDEVQYRFVWTTPSPREHLLTLFFNMGGSEVRVAETRYFRE